MKNLIFHLTKTYILAHFANTKHIKCKCMYINHKIKIFMRYNYYIAITTTESKKYPFKLNFLR